MLAEAGGSVRDITHDRAYAGDGVNRVNVRCVVETRDAEHAEALRECLIGAGYEMR